MRAVNRALGSATVVGELERGEAPPADRAPESPPLAPEFWDRLTRAALVLLALQVLVRAWFLSGAYFFQDDFAHLDLARRLGFSSDYLVRDYGGHLEVGQYALIWFFSHFMGSSFTVAAITVLLMQVGVSLMLWAVLRELFGSSRWLLVPYAMYLFTPLGLAWSTWWAATVQTLPLQFFLLLSIWGAVRFVRDGWQWGSQVSLGAQIGALVMWEKGIFVLPAVLAVHLLVVTQGSLRQRLSSLRTEPRFWVAHVAVLFVYLLIYTSLVGSVVEGNQQVGWRQFFGDAVLHTLLPGLLGAPWSGEGAQSTVYPDTATWVVVLACAVWTLVVLASFRVTGRRAALGWLLAAGYVVADLMLLAFGRAEFLDMLARDPRYVADALPVLAIALAAAFRGRGEPVPATTLPEVRDGGDRGAGRRRVGRAASVSVVPGAFAPTAVALTVGALVVSGLVTQRAMADAVQHAEVRAYAETLLEELAASPEASVVDGPVPYNYSARTTLAQFVNALGQDRVFDAPAATLMAADERGRLRPAEITGGDEKRAEPGSCLQVVDGENREFMGFIHPGSSVQLLRIEYAASALTTLVLTLGERQMEAVLQPGLGEVHFVLPLAQGIITARTVGGQVCVGTTEYGSLGIG